MRRSPLPKDLIVRDCAIPRFEIAFQLCWKYLKAYLEEEHSASCTSPRTCFRAALKHRVLDDTVPDRCHGLRNYTVHTYGEELADYVYSQLAETARRFRNLLGAAVQR